MALFLSHDVDQIHDRGVYRVLGDVNHLRRVLMRRESGDAGACARRIARSLFNPKAMRRQFEAILRIERAHGWRSTFFFLEGARWSPLGARYHLGDQRVRDLGRMLLDAGCEIGVHGGWYDLDDSVGYRRSATRIAEAFGVKPAGIRNHYLRLSGEATWAAQREAGFEYDATFGWPDRIGHRDGRLFPFEPTMNETGQPIGLVALPLVVMDTTLFRYLRFGKQAAIEAVMEIVDRTERAGGLLSLLWHNNYFDEPEYWEWEETYVELLGQIARRQPWSATGAEIARFWRNSHAGMTLAE